MAKTLYEKVFDAHVVYEGKNELPISRKNTILVLNLMKLK